MYKQIIDVIIFLSVYLNQNDPDYLDAIEYIADQLNDIGDNNDKFKRCSEQLGGEIKSLIRDVLFKDSYLDFLLSMQNIQ